MHVRLRRDIWSAGLSLALFNDWKDKFARRSTCISIHLLTHFILCINTPCIHTLLSILNLLPPFLKLRLGVALDHHFYFKLLTITVFIRILGMKIIGNEFWKEWEVEIFCKSPLFEIKVYLEARFDSKLPWAIKRFN